MTSIIPSLIQHEVLNRKEAESLMLEMTSGKYSNIELASILTAFNMRPLTPSELMGFRDGLLEQCTPIHLEGKIRMDLCGTGGDGKNTFNISTLTAVVLSCMGVKVTKHGNYGVSSACGSSNVLEALGVVFQKEQDVLQDQLEHAGLCFLHAPLFHPAMKHVAAVRRAMKVKTIFNLLGPLVNPSFPTHQNTGVFHLSVMRLYQEVLNQTDIEYTLVHSLDGYDEVSLTGAVKTIAKANKKHLEPADFGVKALDPTSIYGGDDVASNAKIFQKIIKGEGTDSQIHAVAANVALAYQTAYPETELKSNFKEALAILKTNAAEQKLNVLKALQG